jgi:hypothetical protein
MNMVQEKIIKGKMKHQRGGVAVLHLIYLCASFMPNEGSTANVRAHKKPSFLTER